VIVGVLGGGQLARMLALAGHPLGIRVRFLDPAEDACAAPVADGLQGEFDDRALLDRLAAGADVITYEFENVPLASVEYLAGQLPVHPSPAALAAAQDRLAEKTLFRELGIDTPRFQAVASLDELTAAVAEVGLPAVLKTRRLGYDGKGQALLRSGDELAGAWADIGGVAAIVESLVPFERELSVIAARGRRGKIAYYPVSENTHRDGILRLSLSRPEDPMQARAEQYLGRLLEHFDYVGVLALELFQVGGRLLANEFAPRVHNTGHWTIEGAETSQFENHLRAVLGLGLGATGPIGQAAMLNCIGAMPSAEQVLAIPEAHLHDYGKAPRTGRKVGHLSLRPEDAQRRRRLVEQLQRLAD
jgi:5-(carboxyamino)imidazole ribonucleotide synthase